MQIVKLACTSPSTLGRPVDAWTPRELADEAERQDIVSSISASSVGRFSGGILKSMASRAVFLSDPSHRIQFLYLPKHTSWLNQVEIWLGILVRRVIKRGNFTSLDDLRAKILAIIDYFNRTAKPFRWTYAGRPLQNLTPCGFPESCTKPHAPGRACSGVSPSSPIVPA